MSELSEQEQQWLEVLSELPTERAPWTLRLKLFFLPLRQSWGFLGHPAIAFALVLIVALPWFVGRSADTFTSPDNSELAQGQRDLAIALQYFNRIQVRAGQRVSGIIDGEIIQPLASSARRVVPPPFSITTKEQSS